MYRLQALMQHKSAHFEILKFKVRQDSLNFVTVVTFNQCYLLAFRNNK